MEIKTGQWLLSVLRTGSFKHVCTLGVSWEQYWIPAILVKTPQIESWLHPSQTNLVFLLLFLNLPGKFSDGRSADVCVAA